MRATIRRSPYTTMRAGAEAALAQLNVDTSATYRLYGETRVQDDPEQDAITVTGEMVLSGAELMAELRFAVIDRIEEVEQTGPDAITLRRTTPYLPSGGEQTLTYSRIR
jgi:hypothetical protein